MCDVRKRAAMHEDGIVLERLHEVRHQRVLEQDGHRAGRADVARRDVLLIAGLRHDDVAEAALQVSEVARQAEDRHDLGGDRDVKAVLAREAVRHTAQRTDDLAQRAVIHVHHAAPEDAARIDLQGVAPIDVVVDHGSEQVVGRRDRVEVAREVEVDVLHRHDLRVAAARRPALHAEAGTERRFADATHCPFANVVQAIREPDGRRGLALARRCWRDGGDQDELAFGARLQAADEVEGDLGLVPAIGVQRVCGNADDARNILNRLHARRARDFKIVLQANRPHGVPRNLAQAAVRSR